MKSVFTRRKMEAGRASVAAYAAALLLLATPSANAQLIMSVAGGTTQPTTRPSPMRGVTTITISPQRLEKPDLTYVLTPRVEDTHKGNAAIKYLEAAGDKPKRSPDEWETIDKLRTCPMAEFDVAAAKEIIGAYGYQLRLLREGARMDHFDWETDMREKGMAGLLPSLGTQRSMANILQIAIRLDIKNHRWAEAQDKLQTGYAFGAHLGQGETLIESLVGLAIASLMNKSLEDWVAEPGAPNLYWPLASLPNPFNDLRRPLAFERANIFFSFPEFHQMREGHYSAEAWAKIAGRIPLFMAISGGSDQPGFPGAGFPGADPSSTWKAQMAATAFAIVEYPHAKEAMLARGMTPREVEAMPVPEVLGRYVIRSLDEAYDDTFKWLSLPMPEAAVGMDKAQEQIHYPLSLTNSLIHIFLPSLGRARVLAARTDRQIAMLRIVENLRAYAAASKSNSLPDTLDQLPLPVPLNPMTGKPFLYERHGDTATLTDPGYNGKPIEGYRYEITLRH